MKAVRSLSFFIALAQLAAAQATEAPATGLADSAALRATVYGTPPQDIAALPASVPLQEINLKLPWARPLPAVLWFDGRLRVWFSAQDQAAPLAILIAGTGADGTASNMATLRAALYGAGYHVLSLPSPTFPRFIAAASSTGVAGDLLQDGRDLYATIQQILKHLPAKVRITETDILGYSLGGANAAVVKSLDATEHRLNIHRAVMINPPVSLFASMNRLDRLFVESIGSDEEGIDRLYRQLYVRLANFYRATDVLHIDSTNVLAAAATVLHTDADFSAAIALTFRLDLMDMFYEGDLYAGTGVVIDPRHPPQPGDPIEQIARVLRLKPFAEYFDKVFVPYYATHRNGATPESLQADNRLEVIGNALRSDPDYYAQTNSNDLILDRDELQWLRSTFGSRIVVYDHGGHLGNLGERRQIADMLDMLAGRWAGVPQ